MAFAPGSVISSAPESHLMRVYRQRLNSTSLPRQPEPVSPVFTVWEILLFVWILVAVTAGVLLCKGVL